MIEKLSSESGLSRFAILSFVCGIIFSILILPISIVNLPEWLNESIYYGLVLSAGFFSVFFGIAGIISIVRNRNLWGGVFVTLGMAPVICAFLFAVWFVVTMSLSGGY